MACLEKNSEKNREMRNSKFPVSLLTHERMAMGKKNTTTERKEKIHEEEKKEVDYERREQFN